MKLRFLGLLSLAMAVCLAPALIAQDEAPQQGGNRGQRAGQRGGPGGPGGFGRGGFGQQNGALQLMGLLGIEEVRKDKAIDMDDETWKAIEAKRPDFQSIPREEMRAAMEKYAAGAQETMDEVLDPSQQKRLMGLLIQQAGYAAAANDLIAKEIGLDKDGIEKVAEAQTEARRELFQNAGGGQGRGAGGRGGDGQGRGGFDPARMQEMMAQMREKTDEAVAKVLSKEQIAKLDEMKGEKFEFPEGGMFGRGFGGGRGPGGGRPGGGGGGRPAGGGRPGGGN